MTEPIWAAVTAEPEPAGSEPAGSEPEPEPAGPPRGNPGRVPRRDTPDPGHWHPGR